MKRKSADGITRKQFELQCVLSGDSDQPAHSDQTLHWEAFWLAKDAKFLYVDNEETEQTAWMSMLI